MSSELRVSCRADAVELVQIVLLKGTLIVAVQLKAGLSVPYRAFKSPLLTTVEYFKSDLISTAVEWCVMRRWAHCLLELCSALVDLRGQASNLFIAVLWVSEEMGMWRGARLASGEDSSSQPD